MHFDPIAFALALPLASLAVQDPAPAPTYAMQWKLAAGQVLDATLEDARTEENTMSISVGGQEPEPQEHSSEHDLKLAWRDEIVAVKGGLPNAVKRKFGELEHTIDFGENEMEFETPLGDQVIGIDERGEEVELDLPKELELEEPMRKALHVDAGLGGFLPLEPVAVGGTWALDGERLQKLLHHGRGWFAAGSHGFGEGGGEHVEIHVGEGSPEAAAAHPKETWEGTCKLVSVEEVEGRKLAKVELRAKSKREAAEGGPAKIEEQGGGVGIAIQFGGGAQEQELEGEMLFDLEGGFVKSVELEIEGESESEQEHEADFGTLKFHSKSSSSRKIELAVAVSTPKK